MSSRTRIIVLRMKEIIYTAIFVGLGILLITLFLVMFRPKKDSIATSGDPAAYIPGVYSSVITLNNQDMNVEVTVNASKITSVALVPLSETVITMYPLCSLPWRSWRNKSWQISPRPAFLIPLNPGILPGCC